MMCSVRGACKHNGTNACDICKRSYTSFFEESVNSDSKCRKCMHYMVGDISAAYYCNNCSDIMQDMFHNKNGAGDEEEYTPKPKRLGLVERVKKRWRNTNYVAKEMIVMIAASIGGLALLVAPAVLLVLVFGN